MRQILFLSAVLPVLLAIGCSNPADGVPAAGVQSASKDSGSAPTDSGGQYFTFGPQAAKVEFVGSKITGSHHGGFHDCTGEFRVVNGKIASTGNKIVIQTASIWADNDRLTGHLKSADFFDVTQFPNAIFVTSGVDQNGSTATVTGNLTLHGVTKQISFPATIDVSQAGVNAKAEFSIKRFDFNIKYPGKANDLIRDEVVLKLDVKAIPGRATFPSA